MIEKGMKIKCLNKGYVQLVDWMGSDQSIDDAARVSYGEGTRKVSETRGLLRYLMRHRHTSPFEMAECIFKIKLPIFVMRQKIRHRTASCNEHSARYSEMVDDFYIPEPEHIHLQSSSNKQGGEGKITAEQANIIIRDLEKQYQIAYDQYTLFLGKKAGTGNSYKEMDEENFKDFQGISREQARVVLPVSNYTECYWKMDLHNLFHYFSLRLDSHAQYEIRVFAEAMYSIVKKLFPLSCEAFEDYRLNSVTLSAMDLEMLKDGLDDFWILNKDNHIDEKGEKLGMSKREISEFKERWMRKEK